MSKSNNYNSSVFLRRSRCDIVGNGINIVAFGHQRVIVFSNGVDNSSGLDGTVPLLPVDFLSWSLGSWLVVVVNKVSQLTGVSLGSRAGGSVIDGFDP